MEIIPKVYFGKKYKDRPITDMLADHDYVNWLRQQPNCSNIVKWIDEWTEKHSNIYNITVNQTLSTNQDSKTPEHNRIQNLFLNDDNIYKFIRYYSENLSFYKLGGVANGVATFEAEFGWDVKVKYEHCNVCEDRCNKNHYQYRIRIVYFEIKPLLGDDYPCVLRKMKSRIEMNYKKIEMKYKNIGFKYTLDEIKENDRFDNIYVLFIKEFNSTYTTKDQLIKIFNQEYIKIVFINEVFPEFSVENTSTSINIENSSSPREEKVILDKEEESELNILKKRVSDAEEVIKYLEKRDSEKEEKIKHIEEMIRKIMLPRKLISSKKTSTSINISNSSSLDEEKVILDKEEESELNTLKKRVSDAEEVIKYLEKRDSEKDEKIKHIEERIMNIIMIKNA